MSNEEQVQRVVERWAQAVEKGDRRAILAHHAKDLLMFDFPDVVEGIEEYDRTWDFFFANPRGPIVYKPSQMSVVASDDVAFVTCQMHCDGTSAGPLDFRLTIGLRKEHDSWTIVHEHHSVPTVEERFLPPEPSRRSAKSAPRHA
jgi:ketosteroid isomerase-like protein